MSTKHVLPNSLVFTAAHGRTAEEHDKPTKLPRLDAPSGLPRGLSGALYVVAAAGFQGKDVKDPKEPCINGDGRVYRISFGDGTDTDTVPTATSKDVVGPTTQSDVQTPPPDVQKYVNLGVARVSVSTKERQGLGVRNLSNTALVPVTVTQEDKSQDVVLLATYDGGRPVAVDPRTLATRGVVGGLKDWKGQLFTKHPFPFYGATAHPAWDPGNQTLWAVNFGRPLKKLAEGGLISRQAFDDHPHKHRLHRKLHHSLEFYAALRQAGHGWSSRKDAALPEPGGMPQLEPTGDEAELAALRDDGVVAAHGLRWADPDRDALAANTTFSTVWSEPHARVLSTEVAKHLRGPDVPDDAPVPRPDDNEPTDLLDAIFAATDLLFGEVAEADGFTEIVRWQPAKGTAEARFHKIPLKSATDNEPIEVFNSAHQLGETEHWVVFADTAFKFDFDITMPDFLPDDLGIGVEARRWLRRLLSRRQPADTPLYFVSKKDLLSHKGSDPVPTYKVVVPGEIVHFVVDEDDGKGNQVRMWVVSQRSSDTAEFVHGSDRGFDNDDIAERGDTVPGRGIGKFAVGMFSAGYDRNDVMTLTISPTEADPTKRVDITGRYSDERCWMLGLPGAPGLGTALTKQRPGAHDRLPTDTARHNEFFYIYSIGLAPEVITRLTYNLYSRRRRPELWQHTAPPYPAKPHDPNTQAYLDLQAFKDLACAGGVPGALYALRRTSDGSIKCVSQYKAPHGVVLLTPQHIPYVGDEDDHAGFLVVPVYRSAPGDHEASRELWVFHAHDLQAPLCRFDAEVLGWRYTLHTAWLPLDVADTKLATVPTSLTEALVQDVDRARNKEGAHWRAYEASIQDVLHHTET